MNKLKTERKKAEEKLIQQQKDFEKQLSKQKELCTKLERTVEKLNKQVYDSRYQHHILRDSYMDLQKRMNASQGDKASKSNSVSSINEKHRVFQDNITPNSNNGRTPNNQVDNDERDVIFF